MLVVITVMKFVVNPTEGVRMESACFVLVCDVTGRPLILIDALLIAEGLNNCKLMLLVSRRSHEVLSQTIRK